MSALSIQPPYITFQETDGQPLEDGYIWIGQANLDPQTNPINVYWDAALTLPAAQPIRTLAGYPANSGTPARLYVNSDYSIRVMNKNGSTVYSAPAATERFGDLITASTIAFTGFKGQVGTVADLADDDGSDWIGFEQSGTGVVARSAQDKMRDIFSVKDFGAVGDGVADDTTAVIAAITAAVASTPSTVVFPAGTYKCTTVLGDFTASNLSLVGEDATLDFSSIATSPGVTMLSFSGSIAAGVSLSSNATEAQKTVSVVSSTFAVGDFVKIKSTSVWDSGRTSSTYGELNFIQAIPGASSVTVANDLMSTYTTAASATIAKITPVRNINIRGLKLQGPTGNDNHKGIVITNGINCTIDGIQSYDMDATHVQFFDSTFCRVLNSYFQESNSSGTGYGTSFSDASQDCSAENNVYTDVRHSLSTNNSAAGGITRRILFANNIVTDSAPATSGSGGDAIDTHAGAEDISIIGNIVNSSSGSGINVECRSATICDNVISFTQNNGITFQNYTDLTGWANVSNNTVRDVLGNYCIVVVPYTASFGTCVINGNDVDLTTTSGIRARPATTFQFVNLTVNGNSVRMTGTSTLGGIDVEGVLSGTICGNSVEAPSVGIIAQGSNNLSITGNSVRLVSTSGASTGYGVRIATSYGCVVNGNTLYDDSNLTASNATSFATTVTYSGVFGNIGSKFTSGTVFNISTGTGNAAANNITGL